MDGTTDTAIGQRHPHLSAAQAHALLALGGVGPDGGEPASGEVAGAAGPRDGLANTAANPGFRRTASAITLAVLGVIGFSVIVPSQSRQDAPNGGAASGSVLAPPEASAHRAGRGGSGFVHPEESMMFAKIQGVAAATAVGAAAMIGATASAQTQRLVPSQYATIQAAVNAAQVGDSVLVSPGTYNEQVNLSGKRIVLQGVAGAASTIIDGQGTRTVMLGTNEPVGCEVSGFTIRNGNGSDAGGMFLSGSSARIHHCVFRANRATSLYGGGGFKSSAGATTVEDCVFIENIGNDGSTAAAWYHYGAGSFILRRCTFDNNIDNPTGQSGPDGGCVAKVNPESSNTAGSTRLIQDCTFVGQRTGQAVPHQWGCIWVHRAFGTPVQVTGCRFAAAVGGQDYAVTSGLSSVVNLSNCTGCGFGTGLASVDGGTGTVTGSTFTSTCADCNGNSVPDLQEIVHGDVPDINGNGIPDVCEGIVAVPGDYATIQAAIDSAPSGLTRTINVAAGTYAGPIDFKGKNVVVRGAGAGATIIGGNGGTTSSVVRMSGEPAAAALEGVTVRGGTTGTQLPDFPTVLVGGGIFANASAASIRDCIVEQNSAGFGGGIYMLACSGQVSGCTIRNNTASTDGGGFQANQSTVRLSNVIVQNNAANSRGGGMHLVQGTPSLSGVTVSGNQSNNLMGGISWYGAGASGTLLDLVSCAVTANSAGGSQGGIGATDGGLVTMHLAGTRVCGNLPLPNLVGQWSDLGGNTVCDCASDLILDGVVNGADLGALLSAWGLCTGACTADINHDGRVDGNDLGVLLAHWGPCGQ